MKRKEVVRIMEAAHSKGERPNLSEFDLGQTDLSRLDLSEAILAGLLGNLIGATLCGADLSKADLSDVLFEENPLAGVYRLDDGTKPAPLPDRIKAIYDDKTKFPEGFDRYEEMGKVD